MENNTELLLPHNFTPRGYQTPLLQNMDGSGLRAVCVWHRRAGKDKTVLNFTFKSMFERVGLYTYYFPTYVQGRTILWEGMDRDGFKFMDHLPESVRQRTDNTRMTVEATNGSIFRIVGTDQPDKLRGGNPVGCVFSEWSEQDPYAWDVVRPILAENGGWAIFIYTPKGKNHGWNIFKMARDDPKWFCQVLTVEDTLAVDSDVLIQEKKEIIAKDGTDALYQQEYMCSFEVPISGAYYAHQLMKADEDKRITSVPYQPTLKVHTAWDLGVGDATSIWFFQQVGMEVHIIDYYETSGEGLHHYAKILQEKNYIYGTHWGPHDLKARELSTGKSRLETAKTMGLHFQVAPNLPVDDGIEAARNLLSLCWFDKDKCERGLSALRSYHKEYDDANQTYKMKPKHDWSSHGADAFRYLAVSHRTQIAETSAVETPVIVDPYE